MQRQSIEPEKTKLSVKLAVQYRLPRLPSCPISDGFHRTTFLQLGQYMPPCSFLPFGNRCELEVLNIIEMKSSCAPKNDPSTLG